MLPLRCIRRWWRIASVEVRRLIEVPLRRNTHKGSCLKLWPSILFPTTFIMKLFSVTSSSLLVLFMTFNVACEFRCCSVQWHIASWIDTSLSISWGADCQTSYLSNLSQSRYHWRSTMQALLFWWVKWSHHWLSFLWLSKVSRSANLLQQCGQLLFRHSIQQLRWCYLTMSYWLLERLPLRDAGFRLRSGSCLYSMRLSLSKVSRWSILHFYNGLYKGYCSIISKETDLSGSPLSSAASSTALLNVDLHQVLRLDYPM